MNLKPCPFCNELPALRGDAAIVCCRNKDCQVRLAVSRITQQEAGDAGNSRPNEPVALPQGAGK